MYRNQKIFLTMFISGKWLELLLLFDLQGLKIQLTQLF